MKKKIGMILLVVIMFMNSCALADTIDLSTYDDDALLELYNQVQQEIQNRNEAAGTSESAQDVIIMQKGSKGDDVKALQENLIMLGYLTGNADGDYGNKTVTAVSAFQKANGLVETGSVTQSLLDIIEEIIADMPEKPLSFTAVELYNKFKQNQIAAEDELNDKLINVTGKVYKIDSSIWGDYFVSLYADSWGFSTVDCYFDDDMKSEISKLKKEQKITIQGLGNGAGILGDPQLKKCIIVG